MGTSPANQCNEDAGDGAYGLSSLSEKTRISNHLQMSLQRQHILLSYFKTLSVCPVWDSNPRPPRTVVRRSTNWANRSAGKNAKPAYAYMVSDNPACAGRFLCEESHPKPHDNSNISRCEAEANKLKKKVETIKDTIAAYDDSLFNERRRKLQTGLTCHHKFNSDTLHLISTGIQDNIAQLIEDLETASKK